MVLTADSHSSMYTADPSSFATVEDEALKEDRVKGHKLAKAIVRNIGERKKVVLQAQVPTSKEERVDENSQAAA